MMELDCHGAVIPPATSRLDENKNLPMPRSNHIAGFVAFYLLINVEEKKIINKEKIRDKFKQ